MDGYNASICLPEQTPSVEPAGAVTMNSPAKAPTAEEAFAEYAPRIYHLARRMLGNEADAQDVTQEVFLQVMRKLPSFRGDAVFSTWLYRVAVNAALAYRRKRAVSEDHRIHDPLEQFREDGTHLKPVRRWSREPENLVLDGETHELIDAAIAKLPEIYRDIYVLADVEEVPSNEIAQTFGLSLAAVKSRLHRARLLMRDALSPYFEEVAV